MFFWMGTFSWVFYLNKGKSQAQGLFCKVKVEEKKTKMLWIINKRRSHILGRKHFVPNRYFDCRRFLSFSKDLSSKNLKKISGSQQHGSWSVLNRGTASRVASMKIRINVRYRVKGFNTAMKYRKAVIWWPELTKHKFKTVNNEHQFKFPLRICRTNGKVWASWNQTE